MLSLRVVLFVPFLTVTSQGRQNGCLKSNASLSTDKDCDSKTDGSDVESNRTSPKGVPFKTPIINVPKDYVGETCNLNTHPSATGFATGKASEQCLHKEATWIGYFDYTVSVKRCSVNLRRKWMVKDGCNASTTKVQIINITLAKLKLQLPENVVKKCNHDIRSLTREIIKTNTRKCSFYMTKIHLINNSLLSNGRCPGSKEVLERTVSIEDGCGRSTEFRQTITSYPTRTENSANEDISYETQVSIIGGAIFLFETLIIVGCILMRLRKRQHRLQWLSRTRQMRMSNVKRVADYNVIDQSDTNLRGQESNSFKRISSIVKY